MRSHRFPVAFALSLAAGSAMAHTGHGANSFFAGLAHPFGGLDHILAMLAVGLFAARHSGAPRGLIPAVVIGAMLAGAVFGAAGGALPFVEAGLAVSVLVLGLLIVRVARMTPAMATSLMTVFVFFQGYAHQAAMSTGALATYAPGFVAASMLLYAAGHLIGRGMPETSSGAAFQRAVGGLIAGAGMLLIGV